MRGVTERHVTEVELFAQVYALCNTSARGYPWARLHCLVSIPLAYSRLRPLPDLICLHGESSHAVVLQNFSRSTSTFACAALHKALPASRAVFARKVDRPLAHSLVTSKERILPHAPAR